MHEIHPKFINMHETCMIDKSTSTTLRSHRALTMNDT